METLVTITKITGRPGALGGFRFTVQYTADGRNWQVNDTQLQPKTFMTGKERGVYIMTQTRDGGLITGLRRPTSKDVEA